MMRALTRLSRRLGALYDCLPEAAGPYVLCDVGCDHGWIPIAAVQEGKAVHAVAMDLRAGPLERAREHIAEAGLSDAIETRLSDGVQQLSAGEADVILVSGLGGGVLQGILEQGREVFEQARLCILQPQTELGAVRSWLFEHKFDFLDERAVFEDGKYYFIILAAFHYREQAGGAPLLDVEREYGRILLEKKDPVLKDYLLFQKKVQAGILAKLPAPPQAMERRQKVLEEQERIRAALEIWGL